MASTESLLEAQLTEAGNNLLHPPDSVDVLLNLLDQVEIILSKVEQSPSKSMQAALAPSVKALVADELLKHPDVDVKVAVASCISEITRITAPDAPYDDDQMKDVFQLIVSSFENLSDKSSRSYGKRTLILETVAKVRSCVVMLDLECDALIVEMFQLFLKAIRDYHPENVFSSMETIMTLVLEESEDISSDLISPILASVKSDNQEFLPIARKLGKKVLLNSAKKLKPYLIQAKNSLGFSLDDYSKVIGSICDGTAGDVGHNDKNASGEQLTEEGKLARASSEGPAQDDENKLAEASSDEAAQEQVTKESVTETCTKVDHPDVERYPKSVMSNGVAETGKEETMEEDLESSKKLEHDQQPDQSVEPDDDSESGKLLKSESKSEQAFNKNGKKQSSLINSTEPSDSSRVDSDKEAEKTVDDEKTCIKEVHSSPTENQSAEEAVVSENDKENVQLASPKALETEATNVASPSPSMSVPDEGRPKKGGRPKKKDNLPQEVAPSVDVVSMKATDVGSDSEVKPKQRSGKKDSTKLTIEEKTPVLVDNCKNKAGTASNSEGKILKQCAMKEATDDIGDGSSSKNKDAGKRRRRGKAMVDKDVAKATIDDDKDLITSPKSVSKSAEDESHLEQTPKTNNKRKRAAGKEKVSDSVEEYGEELVGKNVKVWWPKDKKFYAGVVQSFNQVKKKHKVLYSDGDTETLDLRHEIFEIVESGSISDGEQVTERQSPDRTPVMHRKKKSKTNSEPSAKQRKTEVSRTVEDSSSKLDETATKSVSVRRSRGANKVGGKSEDRAQKSSGKVGDTPRMAGKSIDVDGSTPKANSNSKMDTQKSATKSSSKTNAKDTPKTATKDAPKTASKSQGKGSKTGKKSNANGSGTLESVSVNMNDADPKENSPEMAEASDSAKGKSTETSKGKETVGKSGKKRRRGAKS